VTATRRWIARSLAVAVIVVVGLNVVGLVRYPGGPLRDPSADGMFALDIRPSDQGYYAVGNDPTDWARVGRPLYFGAIHVYNAWPVTATIEAVTALDLTPGLSVDRVLAGVASDDLMPASWADAPAVAADDRPSTDESLGGRFTVPPVQVAQSRPEDIHTTGLLIVVSATEPGRYGFKGVAVDYRVGPFTFRAVQYMELRSCIGPFGPEQTCALDEGT
jgi:hypothetical protein